MKRQYEVKRGRDMGYLFKVQVIHLTVNHLS